MVERTLVKKRKIKGEFQNLHEIAVVISHLTFVITFYVVFLNQKFPLIGSDYSYFIPRIIDTHLHYIVNGLSIQWYTPSFGGGLPSYPNPQQIQFSIPQLLVFFTNPWMAILLSIGIFITIGYIACFSFFKHILGISRGASALGALCFSINGFYLEHINEGHLGYLAYPLLPLVLLNILDTNIPLGIAAIIISISMAILVYGAGFYLVVVFLLSAGMAIPLVYLLRPSNLKFKRLAVLLLIASTLFIFLSGSKLSAVSSFLRFFPREVSDHYNVSTLRGMFGIALQLTTVPLLNPLRMLLGKYPSTAFLQHWTGAQYGIWELDTSVPISIILTLLIGGGYYAIALIRRKIKLALGQIGAILVTIAFAGVTISLAMAKGPIYDFVDRLPFMGSLHVNVRFASAFIFPLVVIGIFLWDSLLSNHCTNNAKNIVFIALHLLTVLSALSYFLISTYISRDFDITSSTQTYQMIRQGSIFPVERIMDVSDPDVFMNMASSRKPLEPIFGYSQEFFKPEYMVGEATSVSGGYFNFTNPTGYVFPELNGTYPFERISVNEREQLFNFLNRRQPDWRIPSFQEFLDKLSASAFLIEILILAGYLFRQSGLSFGKSKQL